MKMKNLIKYIGTPLIATSMLISGCSYPRIPTNDDVIIHKEYQKERVFIRNESGSLSLVEYQQLTFDDEDYILITKGEYNKTSTIYVSGSLYKDVKIGDKFNKKWNYETRDYINNLSIENFYKDYIINKK